MIDLNGDGKVDATDHYIGYNMVNDDKNNYKHTTPKLQTRGAIDYLFYIFGLIGMVAAPIMAIISLINPYDYSGFTKFLFWFLTAFDVFIIVLILKCKKR